MSILILIRVITNKALTILFVFNTTQRNEREHIGNIFMKISVKLIKLDNEYIAICPELDINCFGSSKDEAVRRLRSVIQFYIDSAKELGLEVESFDTITIDGELYSFLSNDTAPPKSNSIN